MGCRLWGRKESDTAEHTHIHTQLAQAIQIFSYSAKFISYLVAQMVKDLPAVWETLGQEDPLEKGMATHSSILAWRIPWTQEPGRLQSMGWQRVRHS